MLPEFEIHRKFENGMTPEAYRAIFQQQAELPDSSQKDIAAKRLLNYTKLNLHRTSRIDKTYAVSPELVAILTGIGEPQRWSVLTEPWCGDSAQNLPYIEKMAEKNSLITMRYLLRDSNLDVMDMYLTDGSRSIPKLIAFDAAGNELFRWGPRPAEAAELYRSLKSQGLPKEAINEKLHLWYGRNRGKALEKEFINLLSPFSNAKI